MSLEKINSLRKRLKAAFKALYDSIQKESEVSWNPTELSNHFKEAVDEVIKEDLEKNPRIKLIRREQWKAKPQHNALVGHVPNKITVHHQGGTQSCPNIHQVTSFNGDATIRAIQSYHMNSRGWVDIGYHFLIAPNGDVYEGRYMNQVGAHVRLNNTGNLGIMVVGNFEVEHPTEAQLVALKNTILHIHDNYPQINIPSCIHGHKEFNYTDCPGKNLYPFVLNLKYSKEPLSN